MVVTRGRAQSPGAPGAEAGWKWDSMVKTMGKRDPESSLAVFPVSEVPAPTRRRQPSPEGECKAVGKLK